MAGWAAGQSWLNLSNMSEDQAVTRIRVPFDYRPRDYQLPMWKAMQGGKRRAVLVWHRRSGKDLTCVNFVAAEMVNRVGSYYYVFPTYNQGRKILWDGMDKEGRPFLRHFPEELRAGKPNETEMKLWFRNGSLFQVIGSDKVDSIVGTNPVGVVLSEYSLQDPAAWGLLRPILAENEGWAIFNYTPRGENHAYDIYNLAKNSPDWFCDMRRASDTGAISGKVLENERKEIIHQYGNDSLYLQEYECDFSVPVVGAYYGELMSRAYREGRVGNVPQESRLKVSTFWDLGVNDRMSIWFIQFMGSEIRCIDYMEGTGKGMDHYIKKVLEKPYVYGRHVGPHDLEVREISSGIARIDTARNLGIDFEVAPKLSINDGIDAARSVLNRCWFDKEKTKDGLNALKSYRKTWDEKKKTYLNQPYHDWSSNGADAFRYFAVSYDYVNESSAANQIEKIPDRYERARLKAEEPIDDDAMAV